MEFTPEQFNKLATKDDLVELREEMATKDELVKFKDEILTAIDGVTKIYKDHDIEHVSNIGAHDRFEKRLNRHGRKIKKLETARA